MPSNKPLVKSPAKSILAKMMGKNGLILAGFAILCVGLISTTYFITRDTIASEMKLALANTLNQIVPSDKYNNQVHHDCMLLPNPQALGSNQPLKAYRMRKDDNGVAIVLESIAANGYSGKISLVVGIYSDQTVAGVRVIEHRETPGLGDKIDIKKSDWILGFNQESFAKTQPALWKVKKDGGKFDAFTGATITPRAVVSQVANTLKYFQENQAELFAAPANCDLNQGGDSE